MTVKSIDAPTEGCVDGRSGNETIMNFRPSHPVPVSLPGWFLPNLGCTCTSYADALFQYDAYSAASSVFSDTLTPTTCLAGVYDACPSVPLEMVSPPPIPILCPPPYDVFIEDSDLINPYGLGSPADLEKQPPIPLPEKEIWNFEFPREHCGRLIGKKGKNILRFMKASGTHISVSDLRPDTSLLRISGQRDEVIRAIQIIKSDFSDVCLSKLVKSKVLPLAYQNDPSMILQLELPNNEAVYVTVSNIIHAGHLFLHLVDTSTKSVLKSLQDQMNLCYNMPHIPRVEPYPEVGTYCAVKNKDSWFRAQVIQRFDETRQVELVLVDDGQAIVSPSTQLRKLRSDFLEIPFQAIECCLNNIIPKHDEILFSLASFLLVKKLTEGKVLEAVTRSINGNIPCVELFLPDKGESGAISLNRKLVEEGVASWCDEYPL